MNENWEGRKVCRNCETEGSMVVSSAFPISACSAVRIADVGTKVLFIEKRLPPPNIIVESGRWIRYSPP